MIKYVKFSLVLIGLMTLCACTTLKNTDPQAENPKAGVKIYQPSKNSAAPADKIACSAALIRLDQLALQSAGTLSANRIPAMPWLRHSRLITSDIRIQTSADDIAQLLRRMSSLAIKGLTYEVAVVPKASINQWRQRYQINLPTHRFITQCSAQLVKNQLKNPQAALRRLKSIPSDDDYSTLARVAGLYPIATVPFRSGVVNEQRQLAKEWGQVSDKQWYQYKPTSPTRINTASHWQQLLAAHAPVWLIDSATGPNLPGAPFWQGDVLKVNTQQPTTYAFVSEARWQQQSITQLNYIIWFSERPRLKRLDWVAGQHDAVVFRVNLNQKGAVIAYDSIHLCGCWYRLFLPPGQPFKINHHYWQEPVLMSRVQLPVGSSPRMAVYLAADTHQIQYLSPAAEVAKASVRITQGYQQKPFSTLLSLPHSSGVKPVFNRQGYVTGSKRPERWLFWPMGVKNPGALRRFGDHAISFVGRRYFDDPHLLERVSGFNHVGKL